MIFEIDLFSRDVWPELQAFLSASRDRYHIATVGPTIVRTGYLAGRFLVTFERCDGDVQITLISTDEVGTGAGLQSYEGGSIYEHRDMINDLLRQWPVIRQDVAAWFSPTERQSIA
jgi:hypothetical protein